MRLRSWLPSVPVLVTALFLSTPADASAGTRVYVRIGPPAPIVEVRRVSPGPRYAWVRGYHRWSGRAYVWVPGRWAVPPRPRAAWVPAHWQRDRHGWFFVRGHWR
jgi:hypothetical protein